MTYKLEKHFCKMLIITAMSIEIKFFSNIRERINTRKKKLNIKILTF